MPSCRHAASYTELRACERQSIGVHATLCRHLLHGAVRGEYSPHQLNRHASHMPHEVARASGSHKGVRDEPRLPLSHQPLAAPAPRPTGGRKPDGKGGRPRLETVRLHACTRPRHEQPRSRHSARASSVIGQLPTRHLGCGHKDRRAGVRVRVGTVGRAGSPCLACSCPCALRAVCRRIWSGCCAC